MTSTTTPNIKLTYFGVRGRVDPIRLLLEEQQVEYQEVNIPIHEWPARKEQLSKEGKLPFHQVPLYEEVDSGLCVVHSQAILRHLARKYNLYGKSALETIRCDIVQESYVDSLREIMGFYWDFEWESKKQTFLQETIPKRLSDLENYLALNESEEYWVGSHVTFVDYSMWCYLDLVRPIGLDQIKQYDRLYKFYQSFANRPLVKQFVETKRHPTITIPMAPLGGTPETS